VVRRVPPGLYLVVADIPGFGFHEVYRLVPGPGQPLGSFTHDTWKDRKDGTVELPPINIPAVKDGVIMMARPALIAGAAGLGACPLGTGPFSAASPLAPASLSDMAYFPGGEFTMGVDLPKRHRLWNGTSSPPHKR
jgi:hypothetical protein